MATKFATQFSHPETVPFVCETPSMTEEQFEYETNINNICSCQVQSSLPVNQAEPIYGLTITGNEYEQQLNATAEVQNYFETLPVKAKEYFEYQPANMLDFIQKSDDYEKAFNIGLIDKSTFEEHKERLLTNSKTSLKDTINAVNTVTTETVVTPSSQE